MTGKNKCKILKEIRKAIAKENNIEYVTSECKYQGNCRGTCPKCESEVRFLEKELEKRRLAGKTVAVAGIATSMILSSGCSLLLSDEIFSEQLMGDVMVSEYSESSKQGTISESSEEYYEQVDGQIQLYSSEEIFSSEESKENSEAIISDEIIITESVEVETVGEIAQ